MFEQLARLTPRPIIKVVPLEMIWRTNVAISKGYDVVDWLQCGVANEWKPAECSRELVNAAVAASPIDVEAMAPGGTDVLPEESHDQEGQSPSEPNTASNGMRALATDHGQRTTDKIASSWTDAFTADNEQPTTVRTASSGTDITRSNDDPLAGAARMVTHEARNSATPRGRTRGIRDEVREPSGDILMRIATRAQYFPGDDARAHRPEAGRSTCLATGGRPARAARPDGGGSQRLGARAR
jgi:hypothetical protein